MSKRYPDTLEINVVLPETTPLPEILAVLQETYWAQLTAGVGKWSVSSDLTVEDGDDLVFRKGVPGPADYEALGEELFARGFDVFAGGYSLSLERIEGAEASFLETYGNRSGWRLFFTNPTVSDDPAAFAALFAAYRLTVETLARRFGVLGAHIYRRGEGFEAPSPPHAMAGLTLYITDTDAVARDYDSPDDYFAGWDSVEYLGAGRALVTRGAEIVDEAAFKAHTLAQNVQLARSAKPGKTTWSSAPYVDDEEDIVYADDVFLNMVGYHADAKMLEFTGAIQGAEQFTPSDIMTLIYYKAYGVDEAQPVETIMVTFLDEVSAKSDARILRDVGVSIQYYTDAGEVVPLSD